MAHRKGCSRSYRENIGDGERLTDVLPNVLALQRLESCRHLILPSRSATAAAIIGPVAVAVRPDTNRVLVRGCLKISAITPVTSMPAVDLIVGVFGRRIVDVLVGAEECRVHIEQRPVLDVRAVRFAWITPRVLQLDEADARPGHVHRLGQGAAGQYRLQTNQQIMSLVDVLRSIRPDGPVGMAREVGHGRAECKRLAGSLAGPAGDKRTTVRGPLA